MLLLITQEIFYPAINLILPEICVHMMKEIRKEKRYTTKIKSNTVNKNFIHPFNKREKKRLKQIN